MAKDLPIDWEENKHGPKRRGREFAIAMAVVYGLAGILAMLVAGLNVLNKDTRDPDNEDDPKWASNSTSAPRPLALGQGNYPYRVHLTDTQVIEFHSGCSDCVHLDDHLWSGALREDAPELQNTIHPPLDISDSIRPCYINVDIPFRHLYIYVRQGRSTRSTYCCWTSGHLEQLQQHVSLTEEVEARKRIAEQERKRPGRRRRRSRSGSSSSSGSRMSNMPRLPMMGPGFPMSGHTTAGELSDDPYGVRHPLQNSLQISHGLDKKGIKEHLLLSLPLDVFVLMSQPTFPLARLRIYPQRPSPDHHIYCPSGHFSSHQPVISNQKTAHQNHKISTIPGPDESPHGCFFTSIHVLSFVTGVISGVCGFVLGIASNLDPLCKAEVGNAKTYFGLAVGLLGGFSGFGCVFGLNKYWKRDSYWGDGKYPIISFLGFMLSMGVFALYAPSFLTRDGGLCKGQMFIALAGGIAWFIMSIGNYIFCCRHRRKAKKSGGDEVNNDGGFMMNSYAPGGHHGVQHNGFSGHIGQYYTTA
ncbi:hypothetical protein V8F06_007982 [Rhypophila decipiens]